MSRVPAENEFFGSHVVNGEYDAGASVSLVSGVIVNVRVFPFFFVVTRDDDMPLVVREAGNFLANKISRRCVLMKKSLLFRIAVVSRLASLMMASGDMVSKNIILQILN